MIEALGVLRIAAAENWPARSEAIDAIQSILHDLEPTTRRSARAERAMTALSR